MTKLYFLFLRLLFCILLLVYLNISAQHAIYCFPTKNPNHIEKIQLSLENEDYTEIAEYLAKKIQIDIRSRKGNYSKAQTKYIIKEFFNNNPLEKVQLLEDKDGLATFCGLGRKGNYEIKIRILTTDEGYNISEIYIEIPN